MESLESSGMTGALSMRFPAALHVTAIWSTCKAVRRVVRPSPEWPSCLAAALLEDRPDRRGQASRHVVDQRVLVVADRELTADHDVADIGGGGGEDH